jgi:4-hydroxy-3-polyprenylbenzoate decarboxylase
MQQKNRKIALAITGASGSIYAKVMLDKLEKLKSNFENIAVVMSDNAQTVWQLELKNELYKNYSFTFFEKNNFMAPFASGSAKYDTLIICPCSMGTLARIAAGISNDLITRAADVILKERRKLILVTRDTPLNLIHINNMKTVTESGGLLCPASPSVILIPQILKSLHLQ